jgi:probable HAF family extracellular repeat protein
MKTPARILALAASVALLSVTTLAEAPEIQTLKNLKVASIKVPGASTTEAMGINNLGDIVGSWEDAVTRKRYGFLLSGGVYTPIDIPGAVLTVANDINDAGDIVGTYYEPADAGELFGASHGYLLSADGQLTTITVPGQRVTWAFGINNQGQIVGGYSEWSGDQVLGVHGFMLDTGTFTPVDFPVPTPRAHILVTYASGINDAGDIVGGYNEDDIDETRRGFVLRDGVYSTFDVPGAAFTDIFAINNAGGMAGEYLDFDGLIYGFLFSPDRGFHRLAGTGNSKQRFRWLLPFGLNDSGRIAGSGATIDGSLGSFVAEPPTGWLPESIQFSRVR